MTERLNNLKLQLSRLDSLLSRLNDDMTSLESDVLAHLQSESEKR